MLYELFFNELSVSPLDNQILSKTTPDEVRKKLSDFALLLRDFGKFGITVLRTQRDFRQIEFIPNYSFQNWMAEPDNIVSRESKQLIKSRATKGRYLEDIKTLIDESGVFEWQGKLHEFKYDSKVVHGLGAAYILDGIGISINFESCWDSTNINLAHVQIDEATESEKIIEVKHSSNLTHVQKHALIYSPSDKHLSSGWGTTMDLDDDAAQKVLSKSIGVSGKKQRYSYHEGKCYEFQPDNMGTYHGYPVPGVQILEALSVFVSNGTITEVTYNSLRKQSTLD